MTSRLIVASMMICEAPKLLNKKLVLSCCDSVWKPVESLPDEIEPYFTDELGNKMVDYGGFVQIISLNVLKLLNKRGLFACFRCITEGYFKHIQANPPKEIYQNLFCDLKPVGWDIATGNGWLSASCHGRFPIDPFTGYETDQNADQINKYGLFSRLEDCLIYCQINNAEIPEHAPWYPVSIYVDKGSYARLKKILLKIK